MKFRLRLQDTMRCRYMVLWGTFQEACLSREPRRVALSFTIAFFIGIVPFIGVTFLTVTLVGAWLKLNQVIVQTVHLLVSPLQVLLIPFFFKSGQLVFHATPVTEMGYDLMSGNVLAFFRQFGITLLHGLTVWLFASSIFGLLMYRILFRIFRNRTAPESESLMTHE